MSNNKKDKFLFNLNNFDTPDEEVVEVVEEEIEVEPPAPTFSEDELEAARSIAYTKGFNEGQNEAQQQREQQITETLQKISEDFSALYAAETYRERQYEEESLKLSLEILTQLSPILRETLGEDNLKAILKDEIVKQSNQSEILIEVNPDSATDIGGYIETLWRDKDNAPKCKVVANSEISTGACKIEWTDGGMLRNPQETAENIKRNIENLLRDNNKNQQDAS